jgi:hypothetical protein
LISLADYVIAILVRLGVLLGALLAACGFAQADVLVHFVRFLDETAADQAQLRDVFIHLHTGKLEVVAVAALA